MEERASNMSKEAQFTSVNEGKKQELALLTDEEKKLDKELAELSGQLDFLVKQAAEFEAEQKKSVDMKVEMEDVQSDVAEVVSTKEGKSKEGVTTNADLQSAVSIFEEASTVVAKSVAEKEENDKAMVDVLEPANARKVGAIKEKEKLAGDIVSMQKTIEEAQNNDPATGVEAKVVAKSNELKEQKTKLEKACADFEEAQKNDSAAALSLAGELKEYKEFASKFEAATKAEIDRLAVLKRDRIGARVEFLERRKSDLNVLEGDQKSDISNLKQLKAYLLEMLKVKSTIEEEPLLDRNGEAIELPCANEDGWGTDAGSCCAEGSDC